MAYVKATLRVLDLKGETISTRWGDVTFDKDGMATLEVPEEELHMLRETHPFPWLYEPEVKAKAEAEAKAEEVPSADKTAFDTSDEETPQPESKKSTKGARK